MIKNNPRYNPLYKNIVIISHNNEITLAIAFKLLLAYNETGRILYINANSFKE